MKILFITESFPYPLDSGGEIVSHQMLTMLSAKHSVHLVALTDVQPTKEEVRAIEALGVKVGVVVSKKRDPWYKPPKREFIQSLLRGKPPVFRSFHDESVVNQVNYLLEKEHFDVIHVEHLSMAQYFPKIKSTKWILQEQNIEYKLYGAFSRFSPFLSKEQVFHACNYLMLSHYERSVLRRVDQVIVLSKQDKTQLTEIGIPSGKILVVPPFITPVKKTPAHNKRKKELLFIGNLWWKPNLDAITWFLKKIFPIVLNENNTVSLTIIGDGGHLLSYYKRKGITILNAQQNIDPYLNRASIFILPFRMGQGVRIKALTAFSYGLPVVSTGVGVRGLSARTGIEYLKAETPSEFALQIATLIDQQKIQKKLITNAKELLQKNHNPIVTKRYLLKYYARD